MGDANDSGAYVAVFLLPKARRIRIGRLGRFDFAAGVYLYVGSARRNLTARLDRHARRRKPLRWHIDYLSVHARMAGAIVVEGPEAHECALAAELAETFDRAVPRFGSSDCRCAGHLFYARELP